MNYLEEMIYLLLNILSNDDKSTEDHVRMIKAGINVLTIYNNTYLGEKDYINDLINDLKGEVLMAVSNKENFKRWGIHYLPSLLGSFESSL